MRRQVSLLGIAACAALAIAGLLVWLRAPASDRAVVDGPASATGSATGAESSSRESTDVAVAPESASGASPRAAVTATRATTPPAPPVAPKSAPPAPVVSVTLLGSFRRPDGSEIEVDRARTELRDALGLVRSVDVQRSKSVRMTALAPGRYTVRVEAPGFEHREQIVDSSRVENAKREGNSEPVFEEQLVLWPAGWVAVVLETTDGRPFSALASDMGFEPVRVFAGAFQVRTRLDPPSVRDTPGSGETPPDPAALARFRPPSGYKSWELPKSSIGSLELMRAPPFWVGLDVYGTPFGWELLSPGAREIVFRLDLAALEERFARVKLRVVDETGRKPVEHALVTLRADSSVHRRADLTDVASPADGRVELVRVVPGRYELCVVRGESQHLEMVDLHPGERRDLGDIALGLAAGIEVLVVGVDGKPAEAFVEIGPYEKGARCGDLYPQMLRHHSDGRGHEKLPMPSGTSIVRAAVAIGRSNGAGSSQEVRGARSANLLLDPRSIPNPPLRLELREPFQVHIATKRAEGARIEVLDELDLVVARSVKTTDRALDAELVPGRYRAHAVTPEGVAGLDTPFVVDRAAQRIDVD